MRVLDLVTVGLPLATQMAARLKAIEAQLSSDAPRPVEALQEIAAIQAEAGPFLADMDALATAIDGVLGTFISQLKNAILADEQAIATKATAIKTAIEAAQQS